MYFFYFLLFCTAHCVVILARVFHFLQHYAGPGIKKKQILFVYFVVFRRKLKDSTSTSRATFFQSNVGFMFFECNQTTALSGLHMSIGFMLIDDTSHSLLSSLHQIFSNIVFIFIPRIIIFLCI